MQYELAATELLEVVDALLFRANAQARARNRPSEIGHKVSRNLNAFEANCAGARSYARVDVTLVADAIPASAGQMSEIALFRLPTVFRVGTTKD